MMVKRYIVNDMSEAMMKIKAELGVDAVILNTRKIKSRGFFKLFKKPLIEVVAAVDESKTKEKTVEKPGPNTYIKQPVGMDRNNIRPRNTEILKENRSSHSPTITDKGSRIRYEDKRQESESMSLISEQIQNLAEKVQSLENKSKFSQSLGNSFESPEQMAEKEYIDFLKEMDIEPVFAEKIIQIVKRQVGITHSNKETIINSIKVVMKDLLGDIKPIQNTHESKPSINLFIGPTGVGKTTTLAKIAAQLSLVENKTVGLITADTYRIAAVEQLKTYSEILGLPLEVVYEADEIKNAIEKFSDKDYILVDTAGRSHKSDVVQTDFNELTSVCEEYNVFLVLSMANSYKNMEKIVGAYEFIPDYRLLFTKLDEASSYGNILNMKMLTGKPLSYFTVGQSVPDDIEDANKEKLVGYIFGEI